MFGLKKSGFVHKKIRLTGKENLYNRSNYKRRKKNKRQSKLSRAGPKLISDVSKTTSRLSLFLTSREPFQNKQKKNLQRSARYTFLPRIPLSRAFLKTRSRFQWNETC